MAEPPTPEQLRRWANEPIMGTEMVPLHQNTVRALADELDRLIAIEREGPQKPPDKETSDLVMAAWVVFEGAEEVNKRLQAWIEKRRAST